MTNEREKLIEAVMEAIRPGVVSKMPRINLNKPIFDQTKAHANAALAVVLEQLREVTPVMVAAWDDAKPALPGEKDKWTSESCAAADWLAMLNASPLAEGQSATVREDGK